MNKTERKMYAYKQECINAESDLIELEGIIIDGLHDLLVDRDVANKAIEKIKLMIDGIHESFMKASRME